MFRLISAICAFVGAWVICWASWPATRNVIFHLGEFGVSGALAIAAVVGYVAIRGKDD